MICLLYTSVLYLKSINTPVIFYYFIMMQHSLTVICTHLIIRSYYLIILIFSSLIFKLFMLLFSYFRTTEQNRHCFVQFANQKFKSHLLTPESLSLIHIFLTLASIAANGSSKSSTCGFGASALANATRRCV